MTVIAERWGGGRGEGAKVAAGRRGLAAALAVLASGLLAGCGSGAGQGPTPVGSPSPTAGGPPTADQLLRLTTACSEATNGRYATDAGGPATIPICRLNGAVYWHADMDIDCDGLRTPACNEDTDPAYQNQTSATDSRGNWLDASTLPYVVVPLPSRRFDYRAAGLALGSVVAVIYAGKLNYGVFGDEGPDDIIGEASYAMAQSLGIDPDPATGGVDSGVTYIAFTGPTGIVAPIEDHGEAVRVGERRAAELLAGN